EGHSPTSRMKKSRLETRGFSAKSCDTVSDGLAEISQAPGQLVVPKHHRHARQVRHPSRRLKPASCSNIRISNAVHSTNRSGNRSSRSMRIEQARHVAF